MLTEWAPGDLYATHLRKPHRITVILPYANTSPGRKNTLLVQQAQCGLIKQPELIQHLLRD